MTFPRFALKVIPTFPANVVGAGGIEVTKANGLYTIAPAFDELGLMSVLDAPSTTFFQAWNQTTDEYKTASLATITTAVAGNAGLVAAVEAAVTADTEFSDDVAESIVASPTSVTALAAAVAADTTLMAYVVANMFVKQTTTGANYTYITASGGKIIYRSASGANMVDTLPGTGTAVLPAKTIYAVYNNDTSILAIKVASGATLDGASVPIYIGPKQSVYIYSDGSNYITIGKPSRCRLGATTTLYVDATKLDSNTGLSTTDAWLTVNKAWNTLRDQFDLNGFMAIITLANGTYGGILCTGALVGQGPQNVGSVPMTGGTYTLSSSVPASCIISGDVTTPTNVIIDASASGLAVGGSDGAKFLFRGARIKALTYGMVASGSGTEVLYYKVDFAGCTSGDNYVSTFGYLSPVGNCSVAAESVAHIIQVAQGFFDSETAITVTFVNDITYAYTYFCRFEFGGMVDHKLATWDVSALTGGHAIIGKRYQGNANSICHGNGVGANYFPGNAAGTYGGGAYYDA